MSSQKVKTGFLTPTEKIETVCGPKQLDSLLIRIEVREEIILMEPQKYVIMVLWSLHSDAI